MKKCLLPILLVVVYFSCSSQKDREPYIEYAPMLLGASDSLVIEYLDSLNLIRPHPNFKIDRDVSDSGDLILKAKYDPNDEKYLKCKSIYTRFQRFDKEVCVMQIVVGSAVYASYNLKYIKDNFSPIADGKWERKLGNYIITATYEKHVTDPSGYAITYKLLENKH